MNPAQPSQSPSIIKLYECLKLINSNNNKDEAFELDTLAPLSESMRVEDGGDHRCASKLDPF